MNLLFFLTVIGSIMEELIVIFTLFKILKNVNIVSTFKYILSRILETLHLNLFTNRFTNITFSNLVSVLKEVSIEEGNSTILSYALS